MSFVPAMCVLMIQAMVRCYIEMFGHIHLLKRHDCLRRSFAMCLPRTTDDFHLLQPSNSAPVLARAKKSQSGKPAPLLLELRKQRWNTCQSGINGPGLKRCPATHEFFRLLRD